LQTWRRKSGRFASVLRISKNGLTSNETEPKYNKHALTSQREN
jgi:hypothetical protein